MASSEVRHADGGAFLLVTTRVRHSIASTVLTVIAIQSISNSDTVQQ